MYQRLLERVKPERDQNNRATYRDNWWVFGEARKDLRPAHVGLPRILDTFEAPGRAQLVVSDGEVRWRA